MLPTANPASSFTRAISDTESSGSDVPNATIVVPMISGEIRKAREIFFANLTNAWVDSERKITPKQNFNNNSNTRSLYVF